jgi:hypothetical protein
MGRRPIFKKAMTEAERKRRLRMLATTPLERAARIRRAFEAAGEDAQAIFIKWLRSMKLLK